MKIEEVKFDSSGLVPAIVQDAATGEVLTLAYMNRQSLQKSLETGETWFYSRSRQQLWHKGETSGNVHRIVEMHLDCDGDAILVTVKAAGPACHTGERSCFHRLSGSGRREGRSLPVVLAELQEVIRRRRAEMPQGSYTAELFQAGTGEISKKVGEEGVEVAVAALSQTRERVVSEVSDLVYHLLVLLEDRGIALDEVAGELASRHK